MKQKLLIVFALFLVLLFLNRSIKLNTEKTVSNEPVLTPTQTITPSVSPTNTPTITPTFAPTATVTITPVPTKNPCDSCRGKKCLDIPCSNF